MWRRRFLWLWALKNEDNVLILWLQNQGAVVSLVQKQRQQWRRHWRLHFFPHRNRPTAAEERCSGWTTNGIFSKNGQGEYNLSVMWGGTLFLELSIGMWWTARLSYNPPPFELITTSIQPICQLGAFSPHQ